MSSALFQPIHLRSVTLPNRVIIAPMCMYSAKEGSATDWHTIHLGNLALSGAGLLIVEATGVEARSRISPGCTGLYSDANEAAMKRVIDIVRTYSAMPLGIQLGHAGRKASTNPPQIGGAPLTAAEGAWETVGPSATPFGDGWDDEGLQVEDAIVFAKALAGAGCDFLDISGGSNSLVRPPLAPGYQAGYAAQIKAASGIPTMAVGMIRDPRLAESLAASGDVDMIAMARGILYEPRWALARRLRTGRDRALRPAIWPCRARQVDPGIPRGTSSRIGGVAVRG